MRKFSLSLLLLLLIGVSLLAAGCGSGYNLPLSEKNVEKLLEEAGSDLVITEINPLENGYVGFLLDNGEEHWIHVGSNRVGKAEVISVIAKIAKSYNLEQRRSITYQTMPQIFAALGKVLGEEEQAALAAEDFIACMGIKGTHPSGSFNWEYKLGEYYLDIKWQYDSSTSTGVPDIVLSFLISVENQAAADLPLVDPRDEED